MNKPRKLTKSEMDRAQGGGPTSGQAYCDYYFRGSIWNAHRARCIYPSSSSTGGTYNGPSSGISSPTNKQ